LIRKITREGKSIPLPTIGGIEMKRLGKLRPSEDVFLQGDYATEALSGNCEICNEPLTKHYELDAFGNVQMYAEIDRRGDLIGFLCPSCAID
jgi:hypothetical protein